MRKNWINRCMLLLAVLSMLLGGFAAAESPVTEAEGVTTAEEFVEEDEGTALQEEMEQILADVTESEAIKADYDVIKNDMVINILLIGTDERKSDFSENARGDTCILCSVNAQTGNLNLISFERAIGVEILDGEYKGEWDWLTNSFRYGGPELMTREIREHFKIDVTKYVRVNLHTFVRLVDAVGGVDIELTKEEADYINGPDGHENARDIGSTGDLQKVHAGANHLNGATALVYARCRKIDSDWNRVSRQRNVIAAAAKQLMTSNGEGVMNALLEMLPLVQTNISWNEALPLALMAPKLLNCSIEQTTIPAEGTYGSKHGMEDRSMYSVDFQTNAELIRQLLYQ